MFFEFICLDKVIIYLMIEGKWLEFNQSVHKWFSFQKFSFFSALIDKFSFWKIFCDWMKMIEIQSINHFYSDLLKVRFFIWKCKSKKNLLRVYFFRGNHKQGSFVSCENINCIYIGFCLTWAISFSILFNASTTKRRKVLLLQRVTTRVRSTSMLHNELNLLKYQWKPFLQVSHEIKQF